MGMSEPVVDTTVFRWIESQTSSRDRLALLSLREAVCSAEGRYVYLEVGSHLGGSLQPHVIDPRCRKIISIDPRPAFQADDRWSAPYTYPDNSTDRMLRLLGQIPGADLSKLATFEVPSWELQPGSVPTGAGLAFIDGEHTNQAVGRDFLAVRPHVSRDGVIAFHDCYVTPLAFLRVRTMLRREGAKHAFLHYPESAVVAIVFESEELRRRLTAWGWLERLPASYWDVIKVRLKRAVGWSGDWWSR
jgi:hypothetical protein